TVLAGVVELRPEFACAVVTVVLGVVVVAETVVAESVPAVSLAAETVTAVLLAAETVATGRPGEAGRGRAHDRTLLPASGAAGGVGPLRALAQQISRDGLPGQQLLILAGQIPRLGGQRAGVGAGLTRWWRSGGRLPLLAALARRPRGQAPATASGRPGGLVLFRARRHRRERTLLSLTEIRGRRRPARRLRARPLGRGDRCRIAHGDLVRAPAVGAAQPAAVGTAARRCGGRDGGRLRRDTGGRGARRGETRGRGRWFGTRRFRGGRGEGRRRREGRGRHAGCGGHPRGRAADDDGGVLVRVELAPAPAATGRFRGRRGL